MDWIFADHVQVFCFPESGMKQHVHFLLNATSFMRKISLSKV